MFLQLFPKIPEIFEYICSINFDILLDAIVSFFTELCHSIYPCSFFLFFFSDEYVTRVFSNSIDKEEVYTQM